MTEKEYVDAPDQTLEQQGIASEAIKLLRQAQSLLAAVPSEEGSDWRDAQEMITDVCLTLGAENE